MGTEEAPGLDLDAIEARAGERGTGEPGWVADVETLCAEIRRLRGLLPPPGTGPGAIDLEAIAARVAADPGDPLAVYVIELIDAMRHYLRGQRHPRGLGPGTYTGQERTLVLDGRTWVRTCARGAWVELPGPGWSGATSDAPGAAP